MKGLRQILKGASLTTALFIFQACYGSPQVDYPANVKIKVVSAEDGSPLKDVAVNIKPDELSTSQWSLVGYTSEDGTLECGIDIGQPYVFRFEKEDGSYFAKDTVISDCLSPINVKLQKAM